MVGKTEETKPKQIPATKDDILRLFWVLLKQSNVTAKSKMEINIKAFRDIPKNTKIQGEIEGNILRVWLHETASERKKKKRILTPNRNLILPK